MTTTQTGLAKRSTTSDIVTQAQVPAMLANNISQEDWDAMPADERLACYEFFQGEVKNTTENLDITFPRVKYPTSGSGVFEMPSPDGQPEYTPTLTGAVIFKQPVRAFWPVGDPISNNPPVCSSPDGIRPLADSPKKQAEYCVGCPQAVFGTGKEGQGQACKARLNVFTLMDKGGMLDEIPTLISVPPSQLKVFSDYAVQVAKAKSSLLGQCTVFSLIDATNKQGVKYKGLALKFGRKLEYPEMKKARELSTLFMENMVRRGFVVEEAEAEPGTIEARAEVIS
jgi:hypothetical protein